MAKEDDHVLKITLYTSSVNHYAFSMLEFSLSIDPRGKGRPRFRSTGKFVTTYTDAKTREYETELKEQLREQCTGDWQITPTEDPVSVDVTFFIRRPKTVVRKHPTVKPDLDNYLKALFDAMNGIVWKDDALVVRCTVSKEYAAEGGIHIKVSDAIS